MCWGLITPGSAQGAPPDLTALEREYESVHRAYLRSLYEARKVPQEAYLKTLRDWKKEAESLGDASLVREIDEEIQKWEETLKRETEALEGELKNVKPLPLPESSAQSGATGALSGDLSRARLEGGIVWDAVNEQIRDWRGRRSKATLMLRVESGQSYQLILDYACSGPGKRFEIKADGTAFEADLEDSGGLDSRATHTFGVYQAKGSQANLELRSLTTSPRDDLHIHGIRLVPTVD